MTYKDKQDLFRFVYALKCISDDTERMLVITKILKAPFEADELPKIIENLSEYVNTHKKGY